MYTRDAIDRPSCGNAAVLEITGGDTVELYTWYATTFIGGGAEIYCTFSGYLLFATGPPIIVG